MLYWGKKGHKSNTYSQRGIILRLPAESLVQASIGVTDSSNTVSFEQGPEAFDK